MTKQEILARLKAEKVIALIRADSSANLLDCARALSAGGLNCIELTMTTPNALELCAQVAKELPQVLLGLGTVLDAETARKGIAAGAKFIVTPAVRGAGLGRGERSGQDGHIQFLAHGDHGRAHGGRDDELGADVIKIFPAEFFGPAYIKSLKAPFPQLEFLPTGGVTPETVGEFLKNGAFATAAGSALVSAAALKAGDWAAITARAKQFVAAARA